MKGPWQWRQALLKALLVAVFSFMLLRWFERNQVYHPGREMEATGAELKRPWEDVYFKAADGVELNGWYFPARPGSPRAEWVILVCHGNAGNISHRLGMYQALLEHGVNVFAIDYRGYGRSGGRPGEEGTYLDVLAGYAWLRQKGFAGTNIIAYGESLGGGVVSELCRRTETAGLILQSTFTSLPDIGAELYPWLPVRWISTIRYDTRGKLPGLSIPVLILHSRRDELIGFHHAERNFAAANEPKLFREIGGEHNEPLTDRAAFADGIEQFLRLVEATGPARPERPARGTRAPGP
jgi:fermentation-respiration switch protein FrsA (DUF1100 family)